jgi:hypothetical protein
MRPVSTLDATSQGTLGGQVVNMGIDEESLAHIMSVLTNMYSDRVLAIIREYSVNARDSHVAAGKEDVPIRVTLPNEWAPDLIIKDRGVGLSLNDVIEILSKYGASTKRSSDTQTGCLGIGSKSALAYATSFIMIGVKEGVKSEVIIRKEADGSGAMEILDNVPTDEPNGVEVRIPMRYGTEVEQKALDFFKFWKPGTVIIDPNRDGAEPFDPTGLTGNTIKELTPNILVTKGVVDQDYIVMGNVPYPAKSRLADKIFGDANYYGHINTQIVAYVDMQPDPAVAFAPSREELVFNERTEGTIAKIRKTIMSTIEGKIKADLDAATTHAEAIGVFFSWQGTVSRDAMPKGLSWKGEVFKTKYDARHVRYDTKATRYAAQTYSEVTYKELTNDRVLLVHGYEKTETPNALDKKKIKEYIRQMDLEGRNFRPGTVYLFDDLPGSPWTDDLDVHDWEDIKAIRFATSKNVGGLGGSRPIVEWTGNMWTEVSEIDDTEEIAYFSPTEENAENRAHLLKNARPKMRILKLERLLPKAKHFYVVWPEVVKEMRAALTPDEIAAHSLDRDNYVLVERVESLGLTLDDPRAAEVARLKGIDTSAVRHYNSMVTYGDEIRADVDTFDEYALLGQVSSWDLRREDHLIREIVTYMNAIYHQKHEL